MINVLDNDYSIKEMIGKGTFSTVRLAYDRESGKKVAIKILKKEKILNKGDLERAEREISILKKLSHINLIKIYKTVEDSEAYYMVMEYCEKGELFNYITKNIRLDENESAYYFYQLINGLEYLHSLNIAHRDLKPENLLITKNNILKIIDFGLSNFSQMNKLLTTPCGSPCYASPEVVGGKQYDGNMIDIWATGIILFVMLCGSLPFEGQTNEILFKKILQCKIEYPDYLSDISVDLLTKILEPNPEDRIPLKEIKKHLFYLKGREIFKKVHPHLISKVENYNNSNEECKNNTNYSKFLNKTEGNENKKSNNIKKINTLNFKNLFFKIKNLNIIDKSKYNFYNTPKKKNKSKTKNNNFLVDVKSVNNSKNFKKLNSKEKESNNRYYERHLTDISDYTLNKNDILRNNFNLLTSKNIIKQLKYANSKKSSIIPSSVTTESNKVSSTTQRLLPNQRNVFHSLDFNYSNFMFHNDNRKNFDDEPYYVYNSKKFKNLLKSVNVDSVSFEKNRMKEIIPNNSIKKHKLLNLNEKYKLTENTKEHSNILDKKQKVFEIIRDLNILNISKNNTLYNFDGKMNNKTKKIIKKSNNNSQNKYKMGIKLNKIKKDIINLKNNNLFNKYFKLNSKRYFNKIKGNSNDKNYRNDNLNYEYSDTSNHYNKNHKNKYKYNETINTELEKNILNFRYPSVNINNMNYNLNLNLYSPSLYLSTLNTDHSIKNSKIKYDNKNFNKNAEIELKNINNKNSKYNKNKTDKLFTKIKIKEMKEKKEKRENDILSSLNQKLMYQTHNNSIFNDKSFINKNFDNDISKNDTNDNNTNINNHNNNGHSKEHKKNKRIKGIKKLDFGFDLLTLLKQKDKGNLVYKNENKKNLNFEYDYRKIRSPTNFSEKNNLLVSCDNKIRYEYNEFNDKPSLNLGKKKYNKMKIINNKNNNVLNSLIKDFIHFNNINHKTFYTIDANDAKHKNNKSLSGKPIM